MIGPSTSSLHGALTHQALVSTTEANGGMGLITPPAIVSMVSAEPPVARRTSLAGSCD